MSTKSYMTSAIRAANKLRTVLESKVTGNLTVSPHAGMRGGLVQVYLSDTQAEELAELVKDNRAPYRQDWLTEFKFDVNRTAMNQPGLFVLAHWPMKNHRCPENWETRVLNKDIFQALASAYEHMEVCGK